MVSEIIEELKAASEKLDREITSAHNGLRPADEEKSKKARMLVQEAITVILSVG